MPKEENLGRRSLTIVRSQTFSVSKNWILSLDEERINKHINEKQAQVISCLFDALHTAQHHSWNQLSFGAICAFWNFQYDSDLHYANGIRYAESAEKSKYYRKMNKILHTTAAHS